MKGDDDGEEKEGVDVEEEDEGSKGHHELNNCLVTFFYCYVRLLGS